MRIIYAYCSILRIKNNDNYVHASGDECLIEVASALKSSLKRPTDIVARYGGEKIVILLKDIDEKVAKMLLKSVEDLAIVHEHSNVSQFVKISIGVAFKKGENFCKFFR